MKKEPIKLKVKAETLEKIKLLNLNLEDVVKEAFLRGVSHLKGDENFLENLPVASDLKEKETKDNKE